MVLVGPAGPPVANSGCQKAGRKDKSYKADPVLLIRRTVCSDKLVIVAITDHANDSTPIALYCGHGSVGTTM